MVLEWARTGADEHPVTERAASPPPTWLQDQWDAADARAARWRWRGFIAASAMWVFPSLFVWLLVVRSLTGGPTGAPSSGGLLDGDMGALGTFALAVIVEATAVGVLAGIARWAIGTWRVAWALGVAATVWAQLLASAWVIV